MATYSNATNFLPGLGELGLNAFARIQVRRAEITEEHMQNLRVAANLLLSEWAVDVPNLWEVDLITTVLSTGVATYDVLPNTIAILDAYIDIPNGDGTFTGTIIFPVSRTEYASFPNKSQQGRPTVFWFDRLLNPTITVWEVPDPSTTYTLRYYRVRQIDDANYTSGQNVQIPYRFLEPFASGLAAKLAEMYKPEMADALAARAAVKWAKASQQDAEAVPLMLMPGIDGYYR